MIQLYGYDTINTLKILMFLFETETDFEFQPINIRVGDQHSPEFRAINPAGKVPAIWDGAKIQTESNSILLSLARKTGWGLADDPDLYEQLVAWLFYQASTQGPYFGQIEYWSQLAQTPNPDALAQYCQIANRTIEHLEDQLGDTPYFCGGAYSIADIALYPWLRVHKKLGLALDNADNLRGWMDRIYTRSATQNALAYYESIPTLHRLSDIRTTFAAT